jgi:hypothetical protein
VQKSSQKTIHPQYLHQVPVLSATCPDTLQSIAHTTAASLQQGPQTTATTAINSANAGQPPSNNVVTNEVEYFNCSDYVLNLVQILWLNCLLAGFCAKKRVLTTGESFDVLKLCQL